MEHAAVNKRFFGYARRSFLVKQATGCRTDRARSMTDKDIRATVTDNFEGSDVGRGRGECALGGVVRWGSGRLFGVKSCILVYVWCIFGDFLGLARGEVSDFGGCWAVANGIRGWWAGDLSRSLVG